MSAPQSVFDILAARRIRKAREIIETDTHPQHDVVVNAVETAIALDPPAGFVPTPEDVA